MASARKKIKVYLAEEQQILREAFQSFFVSHPVIELVGVSTDTAGESIAKAASVLKPDLILLGIKILQPGAVESLEVIRQSCPDVAIVLLSAYYDLKGIKSLREFSRGASVGCAYLLKHTIDSVEQLVQVLYSVAEGRIILDPTVMDGMMATAESKSQFIKELTPREMEVLSWMAKGYRNNTIAEVLCLDPKTIERHINSIYSKMGDCPDSQHTRVNAVMQYLRATGILPAEDFTKS